MSFRGNRGKQRERGAALVEMALVTPLLLLLLFGIWSVARAYNVKNTMDHAVREGARFGATIDPWDGTSPGQIEAIVNGELAAAGIPGGLVTFGCVELVDENTTGCGGDVASAPADRVAVQIEVQDYELSFVFFNVNVDFSSQAIARYES